ncbi:phosphate regulon sensor histidine kinase PhoR [Rhodoligotrophos defluvii]|uniref:phosphate regulon sensor histidine kinase PhoR n=1 Tax=Rhodoligotrophos defluvii TaxID=2561934 RepID=UPI0010CA1F87|nr:phosphate regulon sensor histidine kinase PhoR [Rhodoligotrophos defluvii]
MTDSEVPLTIAYGLLVACLAALVLTQGFTTANLLIAAGLLGAILLLLFTPGRSREPSPSETLRSVDDNVSAAPAPVLPQIGEAVPDPLLMLDGDGIVRFCNSHARELLELDPVGHHISIGIRAPAILEAIREVNATHKVRRVDYEVRVPVERHFETYIAPIELPFPAGSGRRADGSVLVLMRDFTQAHQIERMRADFIANASHELRTPLASVLGFIETLQGAARNDPAARERFLELMRVQGTRMTRLIDDLLSLSRIEMNAHVPPTAEVNLEQTVRHVIDLLQPLAAEQNVSINITDSVTDHPVIVRGDRDELVQVFQNLIENAIKYGGSGKEVELTFALAGAAVEVTVRDHGPGIPPEHIPRLTERFYRVSTQDSRARGGTGLGLAIVKHILNRHRGKLVIRSTLGEGSSFTVRLPLANGAK